MKRCGQCGEEKPLEAFHRWREGHQPWCRACRRSYDARYHAQNRERRLAQKQLLQAEFKRWYLALKEGRPCSDCGGVFHPAAMQWHHLPGQPKTANVADLGRRHSRRRVIEEIARCELVCANCHAVRTFLSYGA